MRGIAAQRRVAVKVRMELGIQMACQQPLYGASGDVYGFNGDSSSRVVDFFSMQARSESLVTSRCHRRQNNMVPTSASRGEWDLCVGDHNWP